MQTAIIAIIKAGADTLFNLFKKKPKTMPPERWQQHWHEMFDLDPPTENDDSWSLPLPDIDSDYRLLCGLYWTTPECRKQCFEVLPKGHEIWERLEAWYSAPRTPIEEDEARELLDAALANFGALGLPVTPESQMRLISSKEMSLLDAFTKADILTYFGEELDGRLERSSLEYDAYYFLNEPLYWQGNSFRRARVDALAAFGKVGRA